MSLLILLLGCTSEPVKETVTLPTATITWPTPEDVLQQGESVRLVGYVQDPVYSSQPNSLRTLWKVGETEWCVWEDVDAGGNTVCDIEITESGTIPITLQVLNPEEQLGEVVENIFVAANSASTIEILSPNPSTAYYTNIPVDLVAQVTDPDGLSPLLEGTWTSSVQGTLNTDETPNEEGIFSDSLMLNAGLHTLTFTATENGARSSSETVNISIPGPNHEPDCGITTEDYDLIVAEGVEVTLEGTAFDQDIPIEELTVEVSSDLDGVWTDIEIDETGAFVARLPEASVGVQTITLTVTDEVNTSCSTTAELIVGYGPEVEITEPSDGAWYNQGDLILFQGLVSDASDAPEDLSVRWNSNYDGVFSENPALPNGTVVTYAENLTPGNHVISLWAIDSDGFGVMDDVEIFINELPEAPDISFDNPTPTSSDDLTISIDVDAFDAEGDPIAYEYIWNRNGTQSTHTSATIPYADTTRGDVWEVTVTPNDGMGLGDSVSLSTTVLNSPPSVGTINTSLTSAQESDSIDCLTSNLYDEDGDTITTTIEWFVNNTISVTGQSIDGNNFNKGDAVYCQVTPEDGWETGTTIMTTPLTIANTAPVLTNAELSASTVQEADTIVCNHPSATDVDPADASTLTNNYMWFVNGTSTGWTQSSLDGNHFDKGDDVHCSVTPFDGTDAGTAVYSNTVTVQNTPPSITSVTLSPSTAFENSILNCAPQGASDDDSDNISFDYAWYVNNTLIGEQSDTLDGNDFDVDDTVRCEIIPNDGTDNGSTLQSNDVVINNSTPTLSVPTVSPNTGIATNSTLLCSATASDIDDGNLNGSIVYTWNSNAGATHQGAEWTLNNQVSSPNDIVTCTVAVTDANGSTVTQSSSGVSIDNTSPVVGSISVNASTALTGDTLVCSASISDLDDGTLPPYFTWFNGSTPIGNGAEYTISAQDTNVGDQLFCTAEAFDNDNGSVSGSSSTVEVLNSAPNITSLTISPAGAVHNDDTISCTATTSDTDQDSLTTTHQWFVNQSPIATGNSIDLSQHNISPFDTLSCQTIVSDPHQGSDSDNISISIANRAPINSGVTISNTNPSGTDSVSCSASASDPDGDSTSLSYVWTMDGSTIGTGSSIVLTPNTTTVNGTLTCEVTSSDGTATTMTSSSVTIANTNPTINTPSISPNSGVVTGTTLSCSASGSDVDDGTLAPTYQWFKNGSQVATGNSYALSMSNSNVGDTFYCSAIVSDNNGASASSNSSSVTINNTNPSVNSVSISPSSGVFNSSTLSCSASVSDPDQSVSPTYSWRINGSALTSGASVNLNSHSISPTDSISCVASVSDNNGGSDSASTSVTVGNRSPNVLTPTLSNTQPEQTDTVTCSTSANDPDGESLAISYVWTVNGNTIGTGSSISLNPSNAPIGGTLTCTASTTDGYGASDSASASGTISNNPPSISNISISPSSGVVTGTTLSCSASGSDPEDGSLTPTYRWFRNGSQVATGSSFTLTAGNSNVGQSFYCSATVTDSIGVSASANSSSVTVNNTNPSVNSVSISPSSGVFNSSTLSCSASVSDPDQSVSPTYSWRVNGSALTSGASINLNSHSISPTDSISCVASVSDSNGGSDSASTSVTVGNRAPTIQTPSISDTTPAPNSTVTCSTNANDPDGESLTISYVWTVNGNTIGTGSSISLNPSNAPIGGTLTCTTSTTDGYGASDSASASGTISNNPPSISNISISPSSGVVTGTTLSCSASGSDPEDGSLTPTYRWFRNGSQVATGSSFTLTAGNSNVGQSFYCSATVTDSSGASASSNSASVGVNNSTPTVSTPSISPGSGVVTGTTLSCSASGSDVDDGSLTPTYRWFRNGSQVSTGSSYGISASNSNVGDTFYCSASVSDNNGASAASNSSSVTVNNTNPSINTVSISPSSGVYNSSTLYCTASASDPDQSVSPSYSWSVNGSTVSSGFSINLNNHSVNPTDSVACVASVSDSNGGTGSGSTSVTVSNRAPSMTSIYLNPSNPSQYDIVVCFPTANDPDSDPLTMDYTWTINGQIWSDTQAIVLDQTYAPAGATLRCIASAEDPYGATASPISVATTIRSFGSGGGQINSTSDPVLLSTAPSEPTVTITPSSPTTDDDLSCNASGSIDPDGTAVTYHYVWTDGVDAIVSETLESHWTSAEDIWSCSAYAVDAAGESSSSALNVGIGE